MTETSYYLSGGKFTQFDDVCRRIADSIDTSYPIKAIDAYVRSIPYRSKDSLWRKRTAGKIIEDGFITGCTDACLVFVTLSRLKGIPAAYVETIEEGYLSDRTGAIQGHIFADTYEGDIWTPNNPGHGTTDKIENKYLWAGGPFPVYVEVARGLDFSKLYNDCVEEPIDLSSMEQLNDFLKRE